MTNKKASVFQEYFRAFGIAVLIALVLRVFIIQAYRIPSGSMKDTLLVGDFLLVNKFVYGAKSPALLPGTDIELPQVHLPALRKPQRGDIIVFKYPRNPKQDYIKRCVGLPGDTIEIRDGILYVNNQPEGRMQFKDTLYDSVEGRDVEYVQLDTPTGKAYTVRNYLQKTHLNKSFGPEVVPQNHYFVMGDNRDNSADSRFWGFLPDENLVGKALVIYFSWDDTKEPWQFLSAIRWNRIFKNIQ